LFDIKNDKIIWDSRYEIQSDKRTLIYLKKELGKSLFIDQLRSNGWEKISSRETNFEKSIFNLPKKFIYSLPTLKNKNMNILSIPNLNKWLRMWWPGTESNLWFRGAWGLFLIPKDPYKKTYN